MEYSRIGPWACNLRIGPWAFAWGGAYMRGNTVRTDERMYGDKSKGPSTPLRDQKVKKGNRYTDMKMTPIYLASFERLFKYKFHVPNLFKSNHLFLIY